MITAGDDKNSFIGFIESRIGFHSFGVSLHIIPGTKLGTIDIQSLVVDEELGNILKPTIDKQWFREKLEKYKTVKNLAIGLQNIVTEITIEEEKKNIRNYNESVLPLLLMKHLNDVGWDRIIKVNEDLTVLKMKSIDFSGREHIFDIIINPGYPLVCPTIRATLPRQIDIQWNTNNNTSSNNTNNNANNNNLLQILSFIDYEIKKYEKLFVELSVIDSTTWVLEPSQPTFATTSRRLAIERSCSIVIDLNIENPRNMCTMNFFGPLNKINKYRLSMNKNLYLWSIERNVKRNIELILGIILPDKNIDSVTNENLCEECGICYTYSIPLNSDNLQSKSNPVDDNNNNNSSGSSCSSSSNNENSFLNGSKFLSSVSLPDQACSNTNCCKIYHFTCLADWLQSLPSSRTSFGTLFGSCPYCQEAISIRIQR